MPVKHSWTVNENTKTGEATAHCSCGFSASGPTAEVYRQVHGHL